MIGLYGISSLASTALLLFYYAHTRNYHFYTSLVALTLSPLSLVSLLNSFIALSLYVGSILIHLTFGDLRLVESENVYEKGWFTVMDTGLAMTIFRNEFDVKFILIFGFVLFVKVFHWILSDRIDSMDQVLELEWDFYLRAGITLSMLLLVDGLFLSGCYWNFIQKGPDMMLVFSLEISMMVTLLMVAGFKFVMHSLESKSQVVWDDKGQWIFYVELFADLLKLIVYGIFFSIIIMKFGLPIHLIRELYYTFRNFLIKIKDLIQYRRALQNLREKYPNATLEELEKTDKVCIVCREEMEILQEVGVQRMTPKKLGCGHIFHFKCLKSWLERQQSCPTCRSSIIQEDVPAVNQNAPAPENPVNNVPPPPEGIPRFSSMTDVLKNLSEFAEKQGIPMTNFSIRPVVKENGKTAQNHESTIIPAVGSSSPRNFDDFKDYPSTSSSDSTVFEKLESLKILHQQMADMIFDIEISLRTQSTSSKIDKGKEKL